MTCPKCGQPLEPQKITGQVVKGTWFECRPCDYETPMQIQAVRSAKG